MKIMKTYTEKSFIIAMVILLLFAITYLNVFLKVWDKFGNGEVLIALPFIAAGILGIVGGIYSIKGRNEKKSIKKVISILINASVVTLFLGLIINNILDIINALY